MIWGTNTTSKYSVDFNIVTNDEMGELWIEVKEYNGVDHTYDKLRFEGGEYGKAVKYYKKRGNEIKAMYGV